MYKSSNKKFNYYHKFKNIYIFSDEEPDKNITEKSYQTAITSSNSIAATFSLTTHLIFLLENLSS